MMTDLATSTPHDFTAPPAWDPEDQDALTALIADRLAGVLPDPNSPDGERIVHAERALLCALHTTRRLRRLRAGGMTDTDAHLALQALDDGPTRLRAEQARRILETWTG